MSAAVLTSAVALIDAALAVYGDDDDIAAELEAWRVRMREPLRLGIAGMVKAGKSTLLNALIGERIAPTDAGECTRIVTWYRYGATPSVRAVHADGSETSLALRRGDGRLQLDLRGLDPDGIAHIDIRWPALSLRSLVLVDTPGIESISERVSGRSLTFLTPARGGPSEADAIVYLLRHLHPSDLSFLAAFRDADSGAGNSVNALAVLSRADEVGGGRLDALLSARGIAARYREMPALRPLAVTVVPVAGLIAESARSMQERDFAALREIAGWDRDQRDRLLLSADRFIRDGASVLDARTRAGLLDRFGIAGIRLGVALVRGGAATSQRLAEQLVIQSGLEELRSVIRRQFRSRAAALKTRALLAYMNDLVRSRPLAGADSLREGIEGLADASHELRELDVLARSRVDGLGLTGGVVDEAERILGADGTDAAARVDAAPDATRRQLAERADELLTRWRALAESPSTSRAAQRVCAVVVRTLDGILSEVGPAGGGGSMADVEAATGPGAGRREQRRQQSEGQEPGVREREHPERHPGFAGTGELQRDDAQPPEGGQRSA
ncbi:dynamin family protein [Microbacterium sp. 179-B 1A2 NHS]|uniref:dynamin family protein n=1 Tax=Microbacterium sp. 179-B 1A2 NHS TaxID=3142383 RepID=UPI0039A340B4